MVDRWNLKRRAFNLHLLLSLAHFLIQAVLFNQVYLVIKLLQEINTSTKSFIVLPACLGQTFDLQEACREKGRTFYYKHNTVEESFELCTNNEWQDGIDPSCARASDAHLIVLSDEPLTTSLSLYCKQAMPRLCPFKVLTNSQVLVFHTWDRKWHLAIYMMLSLVEHMASGVLEKQKIGLNKVNFSNQTKPMTSLIHGNRGLIWSSLLSHEDSSNWLLSPC